MTGICKLCHIKAKLEQSHIVPKFVFRWLRETSATGFLRQARDINKRVQDGFKEYLLCRSCEQILNKMETEFANGLFYPRVTNPKGKYEYDSWLLSFSVSLSWRFLTLAKRIGLSHFTEIQKKESDLALSAWREFLIGDKKDVGIYQQHVLPLSVVANSSKSDLPTNINRYFLRTVDVDPIANEVQALTYIKIPYFIFIGGIKIDPSQWINTMIQPEKGFIGKDQYTVPQTFGDYIIDKARRIAEIQNTMSDRQKYKIEGTIHNDLTRLSKSEMLKAMWADVKLFGDDVFQ